jgi:hypothetical protein
MPAWPRPRSGLRPLGRHNWDDGRYESESPRPQGGASRKGNFVHIVPLDPAYKAGLAGHVPVTHLNGSMFIANLSFSEPMDRS